MMFNAKIRLHVFVFVIILNISEEVLEQSVQTMIRLLLKEWSDQNLHFLLLVSVFLTDP